MTLSRNFGLFPGLGALEIFIIPMSESEDGSHLVVMNKTNSYGAGFFAGLVVSDDHKLFHLWCLIICSFTIYLFLAHCVLAFYL